MCASLNKRKYKLRTIVPRPIRVDGDIAYVPLTRGYETVIDSEDVALISQWNWQVAITNGLPYAVRYSRRDAQGKQHIIRLHRLLMNVPDGMVVDHIDHDGLNNRRSNLRLATPLQNAHNRLRPKRASNALRGVYRYPGEKKWRARIWSLGERISLGTFDTAEEAHAAYCAEAKRLRGEFACHD
jgi:hypothetical protein